MKTRASAVYLLIFTLANLTALSRQVPGAVGAADRVALVGATVINPADGKVMPHATVVINGDKIERASIGKQDAAALGKQIDWAGTFSLPGYIDTQVHFFQSPGL